MSALRRWALCASCTLSCAGLLASGCGVTCEAPSACDIRDASCQRDVMDALQCVRGGERVEVPVSVVDADAYEREQRAMIEPDAASADELWYRGLALFDLVSRDLDSGEATTIELRNVAAFYDPDERAVTVLDRGSALDDVGSTGVLAHELVHAQQDREHGFDQLDEQFGDSYDALLALRALTEGEATLYASQLSAYGLGFELDDVHFEDALEFYRSEARRELSAQADPWIQLRAFFTYPFGTSYVFEAFEAGGRDGVAALYDSPPVSTRQVVQGFGAAPPGGKPWLEPELAELAVPQLDPFPAHVGTARYGAYALEIALRHWDRDQAVASPRVERSAAPELAATLRADELTVQSNDAGEVLASWRLRFADAEAAARARTAIEMGLDQRRRAAVVARIDRDVLLLAATDHTLSDVDVETLAWTAVPADVATDEPAEQSRRPVRCTRATVLVLP